jgi:alpha-glucosidase
VSEPEAPWWQRGVIYQIYPRSFQDSDGDGVGDLRGITARLGYLRWLGVDAVWISPFYRSPMADFGYDVSDHTDVDPVFGTLADFEALVAGAHREGIRVIVDYVPNHTSELHPWFLESAPSRESPKRDWYIWRDPAPGGGPPNNWVSAFGGSVWEWHAPTGQYYLHTYLREQPDLNWRNPEVERAMLDVLRFWLDRGVDGVRVDAVQNVIKDEALRDNPPNPNYRPGVDDPYRSLRKVYSGDRPEVHGVIARMRSLLEQYGGERVLIGEIYNDLERVMAYYGEGARGCHFPYNFELLRLPWEARTIDAAVRRYESLLPPGAWPNWVLGNHDRHRVATRVGAAQAAVAAMLLLTLRGTPTLYYGEEIGMLDGEIPADRVQDPFEKNVPGMGLGRDPERTPMQWDASQGAGFTSGEPWLPIPEHACLNVERQRDDPGSLLSLYRRLVALRRSEPALALGDYLPVEAPGELLAFVRHHAGRRLLVALNLGPIPASLPFGSTGTELVSTRPTPPGARVRSPLSLAAGEGRIIALDAGPI